MASEVRERVPWVRARLQRRGRRMTRRFGRLTGHLRLTRTSSLRAPFTKPKPLKRERPTAG